jgi:transposase
MTNILNWPDYNVVNVAELEHDYQVQAEVAKPPTHCPHCNHPEIVGFGRREEIVMDTPVHGKRTGIMLNRRRYRCQSCRKTFMEPVPHKDDKRQMTHRLIQYIERESLRRTFSGVAEDVGVDEKTIRNIFNDYCERLEDLVLKIGEDRVQEIEHDNRSPRYSVDDLKRIKRIFSRRAKQFRKRREARV